MAAGVLNRAQERGLKIPKDLSVIGFGGVPFSQWLYPALTTVGLPVDEIVNETLRELQTRIDNQDTGSIRKIGISSRIFERASCGSVSVPVNPAPAAVS